MSRETFTSPTGRLLFGDVFRANTKDAAGNPLTNKQTGEPKIEYSIGVAFPKSDPETAAFLQLVMTTAAAGFPEMFPGGVCNRSTFSFKRIDGDSAVPNQSGKIPNQQKNYPGNWIFRFSTSFAPSAVDERIQPIVEPAALQRGYYVRVAGTISPNNNQQYPGIYLSHSCVQRVGYGEVISVGVDAAVAFAAPAVLPPGASAAPVGSGPLPVAPPPAAYPPVAAPPPPPAPPPAAVPPPAPVPPAPAAAPALAPLPGFGGVAPAPPPPPPAGPPQMKQGSSHTYEQMIASGWTEATLREKGMLA